MAQAPSDSSSVGNFVAKNESKSSTSRETHEIKFDECSHGVGIKVIGGKTSEHDCGIFIKRLLKDGKAINDGRLRVGDEILKVNGQSLENVTYSEALHILRDAASTGKITFLIARDETSHKTFLLLMEEEITTSSECSRSSTPLNTMDTSRSSDESSKTLRSISSQSDTNQHTTGQLGSTSARKPQPKLTVMNNSYVQSDATSSPRNTLPRRQEIRRLANFFSEQLQGDTGMASTPYDQAKESNAQLNRKEVKSQKKIFVSDGGFQNTKQTTYEDSLFAHQLSKDIQSSNGVIIPSDPSIHPDTKYSFKKLETAIKFLGINLNEVQKNQLRTGLVLDSHGYVLYADFVNVMNSLLQENEKSLDLSRLSAPLQVQESQAIKKVDARSKADTDAELNGLLKENMALRQEIHNLRRQLTEQMQLNRSTEKDLIHYRLEVQAAQEEVAALKENVFLAAESHKVASQQEKEYEELIAALERQIQQFREQEAKQLESPKVRKALAALGSHLRCTEKSRRTYEVATEKLLEFCQHVSDIVSGNNALPSAVQKLPAEASSVMAVVRSLLDRDMLPFGWEECYNEEGVRYFINHVTQETSWIHPVTKQAANPRNADLS